MLAARSPLQSWRLACIMACCMWQVCVVVVSVRADSGGSGGVDGDGGGGGGIGVAIGSMDNALRINTDLTAGVIDGGESGALGVAGGVVGGEGKGQNAKMMLLANGNEMLKSLNDTEKQSPITITPTPSQQSVAAANVCVREETYVEQLRVPIVQPVRIRTSNWCLEFPPRCSNYKTEMREVIKMQNITKTRTIRFCCAGYEGNISATDTVCKPVCLGGCGRGYCQQPDVCNCEAGYTGKHCTQRCDHDHWGMRCKNECQCRNGAACDNKSGLCHCTTGWTGEFCELPCPTGTYGVMCRKACECGAGSGGGCHPQSGACERAPNATHAMIETLNSTIANITHNLDRLAKNIGSIVTTERSGAAATTATERAKPLPEVIVIKQAEAAEHAAPKIIVHGTSADLLENIHHAAAMGGKSAEVIHVIAGWPGAAAGNNLTHAGDDLDLASFARDSAVAAAEAERRPKTRPSGGGNGSDRSSNNNNNHNSNVSSSEAEHETSVLMLLLLVLLVVLIGVAGSFLYVYRRYQVQRRRVEAVLSARNSDTFSTHLAAGGLINGSGNSSLGGGAGIGGGGGGVGVNLGLAANQMLPAELSTLNGLEAAALTLGKAAAFPKPLPDLPAFTQPSARTKIDEPEFYDTPSNNSSIKAPSYTYGRKESLYSVVTPKSRKGSQESHLYDEIRYHTPSPTPPMALTVHAGGHKAPTHTAAATIYVPTNGPTALHTLAGSVPSAAAASVPLAPASQQTHHISQLIIQPAAHSKYLQVPQQQLLQRQSSQTSAHKVAHL